jgi:hypothetical protein
MAIPKLDSFGTHRDPTDEEAEVLKHVVTARNAGDQEIADDDDSSRDDYGFLVGTDVNHSALWTSQGYFGTVDSQVEKAERKMTAAIIVLARVKQIDPAGFIETCTARALGQEIDVSKHDTSESAIAARAVAFVLNNLAPEEATSLAGGTDVTNRAMTRAKNAAIVKGSDRFDGHFATKIRTWEESHDRSIFSHGDQYLNRAQRETEVTRREGLTKEQRTALAPLVGPSVLKNQTTAAAKAILGNGS